MRAEEVEEEGKEVMGREEGVLSSNGSAKVGSGVDEVELEDVNGREKLSNWMSGVIKRLARLIEEI